VTVEPTTVPGRRGGDAPRALRDAGRPLGLADLRAAYLTGQATPAVVVDVILAPIARGDDAVWIDVVEAGSLRSRCDELASLPGGPGALPLYGIPFAVKDNIDVRGRVTTAGCPGFANVASGTATAVTLLERAGAILIGKTNLDQFATGLVGVRSPYGVPRNALRGSRRRFDMASGNVQMPFSNKPAAPRLLGTGYLGIQGKDPCTDPRPPSRLSVAPAAPAN
jgi:hypothetical protein